MVTYADKPWTKHYDKGVPTTIDYPEIALHDFLRETAKERPNAPALITSAELPLFGRLDHTVTYGQLDRASDALAAALIDKGLKKGDRVAIVMPNSVAFVISFYATLKAGGVVAATNPTYPADKLAYQINDCDAEFVLCLTMFYDLVKQVQPKTKVKHVIVAKYKEYLPGLARFLFTLAKEKKEGHYLADVKSGDFWFQDLLKQYDGQKPNVDVKPDDLALFQYTGGTTGVSKAAMSSHRGLVANVLQQEAFLRVDGVPGHEEVMLGAIPMFHVFGMVAVLSVGVHMGAKIALVPNARDIDDVLGVINKYKPTLFHGVPALYNAINNHEKVKSGQVDLHSIRLCVSGSAPLPPATKREFEQLSGASLMEGFGMSEAPTATHVNPVRGENRAGSIGLPLPDVECMIVSLDDGVTEMPVGEPGELVIHAPNVMLGYHGMPTETENAIREINGKKWLYTGDIARMDEDGYFYIVDRKKDMALIGGFNVYPANVEKVIKDHEAVLEVGVAAIPHPTKEGQESLKAWVVLQPGKSLTEEELIAHCEKHLAAYEVPRRISFIDELPKTAIGKTLRRELVRLELEEREKAKS
ncbi:MAG: long-chain fatty acid--CoA ligase [Chloroflexi bacterium]|nr:MAG: long-chain fatty acid--CoA ligase [Chloroflexota bacterium]